MTTDTAAATATGLRTIADRLRNQDLALIELQHLLRDARDKVAQIELSYRLMVFDGKTADIRDAQRDDLMLADTSLREARDTMRVIESTVAVKRVERDHLERLYKVELAELRSYGVER